MTVMPTPRAAEAAQYVTPFTQADTDAGNVHADAAPASVIRVTSQADPNILARIVQPMVKLDLLPRQFNVLSDDGGVMLAEIAVSGADETRIKRLESALRTIIGVVSVELR